MDDLLDHVDHLSRVAGPEKMLNLTLGLHKRGYSEKEIRGILGLNMMRVFEAVWQ